MKLIPFGSVTHAPREFFSTEEISQLESAKPGQCVLRVMPICYGGQTYKLTLGGFYYATIQEMRPQ